MPRKDPALRDYGMSDGDLLQKADAIIGFMARDAAEFATQGVADASALQDARDAFDALPTDEALAGLVTDAVTTKKAMKARVEDEVGLIRTAASRAHADRPGIYKSYHFEAFANLSDNDQYRAAKTIAIVIGLQMDAIKTKGYDSNKLDAFKVLNSKYDDAIDDVKMAEAKRDQATQKRVETGNALYALVSEMAAVGQALFVNTDEARYNDYVLEPVGDGNTQPDPGTGGGA